MFILWQVPMAMVKGQFQHRKGAVRGGQDPPMTLTRPSGSASSG